MCPTFLSIGQMLETKTLGGHVLDKKIKVWPELPCFLGFFLQLLGGIFSSSIDLWNWSTIPPQSAYSLDADIYVNHPQSLPPPHLQDYSICNSARWFNLFPWFDPNEWCMINGLLSGGSEPRTSRSWVFCLTTRPQLPAKIRDIKRPLSLQITLCKGPAGILKFLGGQKMSAGTRLGSAGLNHVVQLNTRITLSVYSCTLTLILQCTTNFSADFNNSLMWSLFGHDKMITLTPMITISQFPTFPIKWS